MKEELINTLKFLSEGKSIVYPTDTIWAIGCDATNSKAVQQIYDIKKRNVNKPFICLVSSDLMLERYIEEVPKIAYDIINNSVSPITIIYDNPRGFATNLISKDNTLAIRIVKEGFVHKLIEKFNKPIVSTSANYSESLPPHCFDDVDKSLLNKVDYTVNWGRDTKCNKPSSIVKIAQNETPKIIRH